MTRRSQGLEESKSHSYLQEKHEGRSGELQGTQPHLSPWEVSRANSSENQFQTHEGQEHNQEQSVQICKGKMMPNYPDGLLG